MKPLVSVVIPTFGRPELCRQAAASALAQKGAPGFEVIVVEDGSREAAEGLKQMVGASKGRLRVLWQEHAGPAAARNFGVLAAKAPFIAFLDSDCVASPGWLKAGCDALKEDKRLFGVEGRTEPEHAYELTPFTEAVENRTGGRWLTCNLFVRRAEFLALGGFDERFKAPCREDSEFAFRALAAGKAVAWVPAAMVKHPVRTVDTGRYFMHAREGKWEALIERAHPRAYREHFKWVDGRAIPAFYLAHYAALLILPFCPPTAVSAWLLGSAATLYAWTRRRKTRVTDLLRLFVPALLAPFIRLASVVWGYWKWPKSPV